MCQKTLKSLFRLNPFKLKTKNMSELECLIEYNKSIETYLTDLNNIKYKLILNKLKWYIANLEMKLISSNALNTSNILSISSN